MQSIKSKLLIILSLLILSVTLIRPVNIDEAYYLISAWEVINGKLLYKDFIFHQMPFTIYFYSLISDLGIWSLICGRMISALMISAACVIHLKLLKISSQSRSFGLFIFFYFLNSFFVDWAILIRIYALSVLLFSIGIYYFNKFINLNDSSKHLIISSLAFSLLVFTKISFIVSFLTFLVFAAYISYKKNFLKNIKIILVTSVIPSLFFLLIFGKILNEFYFNLFEVNIITKVNIDSPFIPGLVKFIGFFFLPQNFLLFLIVLFSGFKFSFFEKFIIINIVGLVLVHVFTRMLPEYLSIVSPMLALLAIFRYNKFTDKVILKYKKLTVSHIKYAVIFLYFISIPFGIIHVKNLLEGTELLMNPVQLMDFEKRINSLSGRNILSSWEGYSFFSEKQPIYIDQYGSVFISQYLDKETIKKYNIAVRDDFKTMLENKIPDIVVYDNSNSAQLDGLKEIINHKYRKSFDYKSVEVYSR